MHKYANGFFTPSTLPLPCEEKDDVLTWILTGNERDFIKIKVFFKKVWKNEEECCIIDERTKERVQFAP